MIDLDSVGLIEPNNISVVAPEDIEIPVSSVDYEISKASVDDLSPDAVLDGIYYVKKIESPNEKAENLNEKIEGSKLLDSCLSILKLCKHGVWYERVYSCSAVPFVCTPAVFSDGAKAIHNGTKNHDALLLQESSQGNLNEQ